MSTNQAVTLEDKVSLFRASQRAVLDPSDTGFTPELAVFGGGSGIVNRGTLTKVVGNLGTSNPRAQILGFHTASFRYSETSQDRGMVGGHIYTSMPCKERDEYMIEEGVDAHALAFFNFLAAMPNGIDPGVEQLGSLTLPAGVYKSTMGSFMISGSDLTLDAQGNPNAVWIFQMTSALVVGTPSAPQNVTLINGAQAKNVYWQVGRMARINEAGGGIMVGTILACLGVFFSAPGNSSVTTLYGKAWTLFAPITMANTVIDASGFSGSLPLAENTPREAAKTAGSRKTILLVEDQAIIAAMEAKILEKHGFQVVIAQSGEEAIDTLDNTVDIGMVLMDIDLGSGIDGLHAAVIMFRKHTLPLIFLSSQIEPSIIEKAEAITPYGHVDKNSVESMLVATVKRVFDLHESRIKDI